MHHSMSAGTRSRRAQTHNRSRQQVDASTRSCSSRHFQDFSSANHSTAARGASRRSVAKKQVHSALQQGAPTAAISGGCRKLARTWLTCHREGDGGEGAGAVGFRAHGSQADSCRIAAPQIAAGKAEPHRAGRPPGRYAWTCRHTQSTHACSFTCRPESGVQTHVCGRIFPAVQTHPRNTSQCLWKASLSASRNPMLRSRERSSAWRSTGWEAVEKLQKQGLVPQARCAPATNYLLLPGNSAC